MIPFFLYGHRPRLQFALSGQETMLECQFRWRNPQGPRDGLYPPRDFVSAIIS